MLLAGICDEESELVGDITDPRTMLTPDNTRRWGDWLTGWRTVGQPTGIRFKPLHEVDEERYTVYFPVRSTSHLG